jgi:predicted transcriptional regulator
VPEDVQQRIREMHASGMTCAAIAQELGLSTGAVSKYKNPKPAVCWGRPQRDDGVSLQERHKVLHIDGRTPNAKTPALV